MKRLVCWFFGCRPHVGVRRHMSLLWECQRCHRLVPGGLALKD